MDPRRNSWLAHGGRFPSRVLRPDDTLLRSMVLNMMAVVGFIFLALVFLHLLDGLEISLSLYVYAAIFLAIESAVVAARLYFYCIKRANRVPLIKDVEKTVQPEENVAISKWAYVSSSHSDQGSKTLHKKNNSF